MPTLEEVKRLLAEKNEAEQRFKTAFGEFVKEHAPYKVGMVTEVTSFAYIGQKGKVIDIAPHIGHMGLLGFRVVWTIFKKDGTEGSRWTDDYFYPTDWR